MECVCRCRHGAAQRRRDHQRPTRTGEAYPDRAEGMPQGAHHVEALMINAKRVLRAEDADKPDLGAITKALNEYEAIVQATEQLSDADGRGRIGSMFLNNAKSFLT